MNLRSQIVERGLPKDWVIANFVTNSSGDVAVNGSSRDLSNEVDKASLLAHRDLADVVLTSASTARAEGYRRMPNKPLAIASRTADFAGIPAISGDGLLILIVSRESKAHAVKTFAAKNTLIVALRKYSPRKIRRALKIRGFKRIVLEAGVRFTDWFAEGRALNELALTVVGVDDFKATDANPFFQKFTKVNFKLISVEQYQNTALTKWAVAPKNQ